MDKLFAAVQVMKETHHIRNYVLLDFNIFDFKEVFPMGSCYYFKKGYFGVCSASESDHVPSIAEIEQYCFKENYRLCPIFKVYTLKRYQCNKTEMDHFTYSSNYKEEDKG